MKAIYISLFMLVLGGIAIASSMLSRKQHTSAFLIGRDETQRAHTVPEWEKIEKRLHLEDELQGIDICYLIISDSRLAETSHIQLPVGNSWDNEFDRQDAMTAFKAEYASLSSRNDTSGGKEYSSVYLPLAIQLNALSKMDADTRTAYIYSDLMENTRELQLYDSVVFSHYRANPQELIQYFLNLQPLETMKGVTIYLLNTPITIQADSDFAFISGIYREMLEAKGATVIIARGI